MENLSPLLEHFEGLPDSRMEGKNLHYLLDIVAIVICAVLANTETWEEIAEFGETKQAWFSQWLRLPHGTPSHDTFRRVFELLDPIAFGRCFMVWVQESFALSEKRSPLMGKCCAAVAIVGGVPICKW